MGFRAMVVQFVVPRCIAGADACCQRMSFLLSVFFCLSRFRQVEPVMLGYVPNRADRNGIRKILWVIQII